MRHPQSQTTVDFQQVEFVNWMQRSSMLQMSVHFWNASKLIHFHTFITNFKIFIFFNFRPKCLTTDFHTHTQGSDTNTSNRCKTQMIHIFTLWLFWLKNTLFFKPKLISRSIFYPLLQSINVNRLIIDNFVVLTCNFIEVLL